MKKEVIIVSCGPGLPEIRDELGHATEWVTKCIDKDHLYEFIIMDSYKGQIPTYSEGDAWIITGSSFSVYDDLEWIVELEESIKRAIDVQKPVLGICFGHQLIAQSLGGVVEKNTKGWELGAYQMKKIEQDSIFSDLDTNDVFYASHQDIVTSLPPRAVELAYNDMGNQAFRYGKSIYGVQFHPEFTHQIIKKYVDVRQRMGANVNDKNIKKSNSSHLVVNNFLKLI